MQFKKCGLKGETFYIHYKGPEDDHKLFCMRRIYEKNQWQKDGEKTLRQIFEETKNKQQTN